jgi:class 3 adenylate cyclase/tetratricopeptide (TPR) repeat protein
MLESSGIGLRPLVFVTHSLGGLLVKQVLRNASSYGNACWQDIYDETRGIVFLSTPHAGADAADGVRHLGRLARLSVNVRELQTQSAQLRDLNLWFRTHAPAADIAVQAYYETRRTAGAFVVNATSADPGIRGVVPIGLDADHMTICKFEDRSNPAYRLTLKFVQECVARTIELPRRPIVDPRESVLEVRGVPRVPDHQAPAPAATHGERRLVTALFCDLVGFTPVTEALDLEDVREILALYFEAMDKLVSRYGGSVEKYAGDAILAIFGLPSAHEDDAERAVLCGLAMQEAIRPVADTVQQRYGVELSIRVGIDTGEVVSGSWAASERQGAAVTGDSVNTAARIQSDAEPGTVLVGSVTMRLATRRIVYGEELKLTLKGKSNVVTAHPALAVREDVEERWESPRWATPLVGRRREMTDILEAWLRVLDGRGQLVTVIGEPGVGKSRLLAEAVDRIKEQSSNVRLLRGRCVSYGQSISLWLIADLLRNIFRVRETETAGTNHEQLAGQLHDMLHASDVEDQREAIDVVGEVLGLPPGESIVAQAGPEIRRAALIRSLRRALRALSERSPVVLLVEDLHWIDQASQEVLAQIAVDLPGLRILVLAAQRQGWIAPWSQWSWTERITLRPLDEGDVAALAGAVLTHLPPSPDLLAYLTDRAGGNPFFIEELIRALVETDGLEELDGRLSPKDGVAKQLPVSLTELLQARLDQLDANVKEVAQIGSVIGRSFAVRLLTEVVEQEQGSLEFLLTRLQHAELAFPRRGVELEYVFRHVTVQEVAYGMLVRRRRKDLHLRVARAIASLYSNDEYVEIIAHHYARTDAPEAAEWLERAGDRAAGIDATDIALAHYREACRRLRADHLERAITEADQALPRVVEKVGGVLLAAGRYDESLIELRQATELYMQRGDGEGARRVTARMGMAHRWRGTPGEGISLVKPMVDLLDHGEPTQAGASLHLALANLYFALGRFKEQAAQAEKAAEVARTVGDMRLMGEAEERRATALDNLDQPAEGLRVMEQAIPVIEAGGDLDALRRALNNAAVACDRLGRIELMRKYMERSLVVAERVGNPDQIAFSLGNIGSNLKDAGDWSEARLYLERAVTLVKDRRTAQACAPLWQLGMLTLREGRWKEAAELLSSALAIGDEADDRAARERAQAGLAELEIVKGHPEAAISRLEDLATWEDANPVLQVILAWACLEAQAVERAAHLSTLAVERARTAGDTVSLCPALRVRAMVFLHEHDWARAEELLTEAVEIARVGMDPYEEARTLRQIGLMQIGRGDLDKAREQLEEALAIFQRLGALKDVEQIMDLVG